MISLRRALIPLAILHLTGFAADLTAQAAVVRGRVVRADESVGVANAQLVLTESGRTARSDARGYFVFAEVAAGDVEMRVRRPGFVPAAILLRVSDAGSTEVEIRLTRVAPRLDPVITSAAAPAPRSMREIPGAAAVADSSAIGKGRTVGLHETLAYMPGVQVGSRYGTDDANIGIRGSAARARQAVRGVAILLDGVPLTEPDGVARLDMIELAAARQIEVVRGPASALYAGSPGGVVNVVSRTGRDSPGITARAQRGNSRFRKYDAVAASRFAGQRASAIGAVSHTSTGGFREQSDAQILRVHAALDHLSKAGTRLALQAVGSRLGSRLPGSLTQSEFDSDPRAAAPAAVASRFGRDENRYRAGAQLDKSIGTGAVNGYLFYGGRTLDFPIASQVVDLNLHRIQGGSRVRSGRVAGLPIVATAGFDYDRVNGADRRWANNAGVRGVLRDNGNFAVPGMGAYAQVDWQGSPAVETILGLRYDRVSYEFESSTLNAVPRQHATFDQLSPRIAAVWQPDLATSVYASAGRGFETPAIGEISPSPGTALRSVRPKSLWNYEIGARRIVANRVRLDGAAFMAAVRGEFVPVTVNGATFPENASRSRNAGAELGVTALATPWLDVSAGYAFLDLRLTDYKTFNLSSAGAREELDYAGKRMPGVPRHRMTGDVQIRILDQFNLGLQGEWQGVVYVETGNRREGVWYIQSGPGMPPQPVPFNAVRARALIHLNASGQLGKATVFARVENLSDQKYAGNIVANESQGRFYDTGGPRSASLGISLSGWGRPRSAP